jgi:hypothetical protein
VEEKKEVKLSEKEEYENKKRQTEIEKKKLEKKKKNEDLEKIRKRIEQDKLERMEKLKKEKKEDLKKEEVKKGDLKKEEIKKEYTSTTLKIRLPDGSTKTKEFEPDDTLKTVAKYLIKKDYIEKEDKVSIIITFPRQEYKWKKLKEITLSDAGLVPSGSIVVQPSELRGIVTKGDNYNNNNNNNIGFDGYGDTEY